MFSVPEHFFLVFCQNMTLNLQLLKQGLAVLGTLKPMTITYKYKHNAAFNKSQLMRRNKND
jgi:hypothetical protein